ncbi:hypothetical protein QPK32_08560 [Massilia sp. YIM B02763]|uniref:hypothetical protein n=1 Tax=Massilia sp. YIM B02763 TaxID=3050130 RepID=UPI0025B6AF12|nr:hypothetical protein [Massilia sp. YIM B02763]MDN4053128.1 hypothetical protein [Massilia sp. YIM B02763]
MEKKIEKKERSPNLTAERVKKIVDVIESWEEGKLTWDAIINAIAKKLNATYTRQALSKKPSIQIAYEAKNKFLSLASAGSTSTGIPELDEALRTIDRLKLEIERRKQIENDLMEQFARWAANANENGVDYRILDRPLSAVDRDASLPKPKSKSKAKNKPKLRKVTHIE